LENPKFLTPTRAPSLPPPDLPTRWRKRTFASAWTDAAEHSTISSLNADGDPSNTKTYISRPTTRSHNSTGASQITSVFIMRNDPTRDSTTTCPMTSTSKRRCLYRKKTQSTLNSPQIGLDNKFASDWS